MSDTPATPVAELLLPPSIVSKADFAHMVNEIERIDSELTTSAVRQKVGAESLPLPAMSDQLTAFLQQNNITLTATYNVSDLIQRLQKLKDTAPIIHMTFAVEADRESLGQIAFWLRQSIHPQALIAVGLQPGLVAGVYMRTTNKVFDLSLKGALKGGRAILTQELEALSARA